MANFIVEFPLKTEKYQEDILNKRFEIGRHIYNSLVNVTQKRYKEMVKTKKYRNLLSSLSGNKGCGTIAYAAVPSPGQMPLTQKNCELRMKGIEGFHL